jgi:peptidoglycan/LPS O-acetylase OafA/YrhL
MAFARFGEWLMDAWLAKRYARGGDLLPNWRIFNTSTRTFAIGIGLVVTSLGAIIVMEVDPEWVPVPVSIGFAIALAARIMREQSVVDADPMERQLWRAAIKWLGDGSYSLYLTHYVVLRVVYTAGEFVATRAGIDFNALAPAQLVTAVFAIPSC